MCSTHPEFNFVGKFNPINFQHSQVEPVKVKQDLMLDIANWWVLEFLF